MIVVENDIARSDAGKLVGIAGKGVTFEALKLNGLDASELVEVDRPDDGYGERVNALIRERYTLSEELAILRQRDTKPDEFTQYNTYCEECKTKAKLIGL